MKKVHRKLRGERMSERKMVRLGDIFDLQMGKTPDRNRPEYFNTNTNKWVSIADISKAQKYILETKECISDEAVKNSGIKQIPANTIIMSFKLSIGKTAITTEPMYSNEAIMAFLPNGKYEVDNDFFYHLFSNKNWSEGSNKAVKGVTLNKATLTEVKIPLPPLDEQKQIAAVLDKCADIIAKRKQQLSALDELVKARFVEMFGDYTDSIKLSEVSTITSGLTKNSTRNSMPLKLPYLRVANVFFDNIDTTEMLEIGLTEDEKEKTLLKYGDLLFVEGNGSPDQIGRVAVWRDEITPCVHQNHLIKARFNREMLPVFAMHYFMTEEGRQQIKKKAVSTSGLFTLSVQKVADFVLPNPPLVEQEEFTAFVAQVDKTKETVKKSLEKTKLLFDSLMQRYFG